MITKKSPTTHAQIYTMSCFDPKYVVVGSLWGGMGAKRGGPPVLIPDWPVRPLYIEENINYYAVEMGIRSTWCISGQLLLELDKIIYTRHSITIATEQHSWKTASCYYFCYCCWITTIPLFLMCHRNFSNLKSLFLSVKNNTGGVLITDH